MEEDSRIIALSHVLCVVLTKLGPQDIHWRTNIVSVPVSLGIETESAATVIIEYVLFYSASLGGCAAMHTIGLHCRA